MKRMTATILMLCVLAGLVLIPGVSSADTVYATVRDTVRISTGPGDQYGELPDLKLYRGDQVRVLTKHNNGNETWLQVEFNYSAPGARLCAVCGCERGVAARPDRGAAVHRTHRCAECADGDRSLLAGVPGVSEQHPRQYQRHHL